MLLDQEVRFASVLSLIISFHKLQNWISRVRVIAGIFSWSLVDPAEEFAFLVFADLETFAFSLLLLFLAAFLFGFLEWNFDCERNSSTEAGRRGILLRARSLLPIPLEEETSLSFHPCRASLVFAAYIRISSGDIPSRIVISILYDRLVVLIYMAFLYNLCGHSFVHRI